MVDRKLTCDEQLLRSALHETDPVPDHVLDYARALFVWRGVDLEIAVLASDATSQDVVAGENRDKARLSFVDPSGGKIELSYDPETGSLSGTVEPLASGTCEFIAAGEMRTVEIAHGWFVVSRVSPGPASVILRLDDGRSTKTEWVTL